MGNPRLPVYGSEKPSRLPKDLTGMRFGKLVVLGRVFPVRRGGSVWSCKCDCGGLCKVKRCGLIEGRESCGCLIREVWGKSARLRPYEAVYRVLKDRNKLRYPVDLTYEEFLLFVNEKFCHYCGMELVWYKHISGTVAYNLDRKDNTKGYSKENCVACCARCNCGKGDRFTYDEWYEMTRCLRDKCYYKK